MEKINIANLLRDCPQGMELDCTMYDNAYFEKVDEKAAYPIVIRIGKTDTICLTKEGHWNKFPNAKCVIFPKGKTTWEGFHRPFVDGDILATTGGAYVAIIKKNGGKCYCCCYTQGTYFVTDYVGWFDRFATEEEKAKLFKAIKDNGYRWNSETKTLEELLIFKVGDRIRHKDNGICCTLGEYSEGISAYRTNIGLSITHKDLKQWELVQNKFDITTLKPFDKVLVRDCNEDKWKIDFFSDYNYDGTYQCMTFTKNQCIPYKGNEHLRNTTNSCDDYFKTWNDE